MVSEELFGSIPPGWNYKTLATACAEGGGDIQTGPFGSQLHAADYVPVGIPSIMPQNIGDNRLHEEGIARITSEDAQRLSRYLVRTGDIVYSRRGDVERRALVRAHEDGWLCGTGCLRVRLGEEGADPKFVSHYLGHPSVREWIVRHAHGATMPNLNTSILGACPFLEPPIEEQRAIAQILGTLDDKIELIRKQNETLESMARALFKAWFVDFEPVRAKLDGRWLRGQSLPGLPAHLYDLFPDRIVDSELGENPEGWVLGSFADAVEIIGGGTPKTSVSEYWGGRIPWFSVVDTPAASDVFVVQTEKSISRAGLEGSSARLISKGTTIISARGTVGNLAIAGCEMTFNQSCYALQGKNGSGSYFVFLSAQRMVEQLKAMAHGSVFSTITRQTFEAVRVVLPPVEVLQQFEKNAAALLDPILGHVKESRSLTLLRDTLLPKLISGELRVPDAERIVGAMA